MLYALIVSNIAWVVALSFVLKAHKQTLALADARESARDQNHREHVRHLEDQIVLLKVSPITAAAVAANTEVPDDSLSLSDDEALAEYELERAGLK